MRPNSHFFRVAFFDHVRLEPIHLLGEEGRGLHHILETMINAGALVCNPKKS